MAVVGGGWAGIAAAVHCVSRGDMVSLYEMAPQLGGRARRVDIDGLSLDNGQHILIGAYTQTLALMRRVGVKPEQVLSRRPLALTFPDGSGLRLPAGRPVLSFLQGVLGWRALHFHERIVMLGAAASWALAGFRCEPSTTVQQLAARLPERVRHDLIEPLCVAALNTPAADASASVFLRVLRDALFAGAGSSDLLLPTNTLGALLPEPALAWLREQGAKVHLGSRVLALEPEAGRWRLRPQSTEVIEFDGVVLACTASEAARLAAEASPRWAAAASAFEYEPIVTVYLRSDGTHLREPMVALRADDRHAPAQFVFDLGQCGGPAGVFAFVISGARGWVGAGLEASCAAVLAQAQAAFAADTWRSGPTLIRVLAERRATFVCKPGLARPPAWIAPALVAAGDYVDGPYPATLEGAVRSGLAACDLL